MKIKAACIGTPSGVVHALSSTRFAQAVLSQVVGEALGVTDVLNRPAEYYLQRADEGPAPKEGVMGVEVRLTGVSRSNRANKQFHTALKTLMEITKTSVAAALSKCSRCQIFCVVMIDGDIETAPGSGLHASNLESAPEWVDGLA